MAYTNAFTLGACSLRIYKGFDAGFPVIGFALVDPGDYAAEGLDISEAAGTVTVATDTAASAAFIFAVAPGYVVDNAPARVTLAGGTDLAFIPFTGLKVGDAASLQHNQSSLVWSGTTNQTVEVDTYNDIPEEVEVLFIVPNPAEMLDAIAWGEAGYFISADGALNTTFTFTLEIDGIAPAGACFWQDVIGATQNCIPA